MDQKTNCTCDCKCDFSQIKLDMTVRECLQSLGINPEKAQEFAKKCCQNCCKSN